MYDDSIPVCRKKTDGLTIYKMKEGESNMGAIEIIGGILLIITCVLIIVLVFMQESKSDGLSAMTGATDSYLGKNGGRTFDAMLKRFTKYAAVVFFILTVIVNAIAVFF